MNDSSERIEENDMDWTWKENMRVGKVSLVRSVYNVRIGR